MIQKKQSDVKQNVFLLSLYHHHPGWRQPMLPISSVSFQRYFRFHKFLILCMPLYYLHYRYYRPVLITCTFRYCRTFLEYLEDKRLIQKESHSLVGKSSV